MFKFLDMCASWSTSVQKNKVDQLEIGKTCLNNKWINYGKSIKDYGLTKVRSKPDNF